MLYLIPVVLIIVLVVVAHFIQDNEDLIFRGICLIVVSVVFVTIYYLNVIDTNNKKKYEASKRFVTYSVYIDGLRNDGSEKVLDAKLVRSYNSKYVDFDTGNIQDKLYISKYNDIEQIRVYQEFEYGISCKKDDIIVFSVLPGYDIISWDGAEPVKVTNRRAILVPKKDTDKELNSIVHVKKL